MLHKDVLVGDNHAIQNWNVANATARLALVLLPGDKGKVAWQQDLNVFWFLVNDIGPVWIPALGPAGVIGPTGYYEVFTASTTWVVNHNLGREAMVQVLTSGGLEMLADILVTSVNQVVVTFSQPQAGRVRVL